jgi:hypothetical protein
MPLQETFWAVHWYACRSIWHSVDGELRAATSGEEILEDATLAQQLQPSAIAFDVLHTNYRPMLGLVRELIGVVPNCDPLLEIWPTGFRTYNLLVPNCLNLPFSLFGFGVEKAILGLAMYTASRAAACAYCSAHTCSFALRRGASPASLVGHRTECEEAVVAVAEGMSRIPCDLTTARCAALAKHFSSSDIEWIVLSVGMMGFLNKFMDAMGVELEAQSIEEVASLLTPTGWVPGKHADVELSNVSILPKVDNPGTYFRVIRQVPSAIRMENGWTADVPDRWPEAGDFLEKHTGYRFPLLGRLRHKRVIRALTTVLRDNLDPVQSEVGLATKCLVAFVYATVVENETLVAEARLLAARLAPELDESTFVAIARAASKPVGDLTSIRQVRAELLDLPTLSERNVASIVLARAASTSPAEINPAILSEVSPLLTSASIVELMVWLSIQQLLHRVGCFYAVTSLI